MNILKRYLDNDSYYILMGILDKYPKVLIVGQYFELNSGGGITLTNLFKGWDKDKVAVVCENIVQPDNSVCEKYYQLGLKESRRRFPFNLNLWRKRKASGPPEFNSNIIYKALKTESFKRSFIHSFISRLFYFIGGAYFYKRYNITDELMVWIRNFSPDIIYSQLSNLELISLVDDLKTKLNLPLAIHIMDDWPATIGKQSFFKSFWNKRANMKFRKLLKKSKILLSISEAMSKEYKERYGRNFIHFHNPIDLKLWTVASDKSYKLTENFVILYAGRIGTGIRTCLYDIANAIEELVRIGLRIEFHIQTTSSDSILEDLKKFKFIKINPPVPYIELPVIFSKADLLLLANDFDNESISFLKYSMPTKASEYMASGTPILLYSSNEIAVTKHAFKYNWAYIVSEKNKNKLEFAISELYENEELRNRLGRTAREYAIKNFDGMIIRDQFRRSFILE